MREMVDRAPKGIGASPLGIRYDAIFLKPPLTAEKAMRSVPPKEGVDERGTSVQASSFYSRLASKASRSRIGRIVGNDRSTGRNIRNWNTTTKLLALMEA